MTPMITQVSSCSTCSRVIGACPPGQSAGGETAATTMRQPIRMPAI
jgi:hypothetical protein